MKFCNNVLAVLLALLAIGFTSNVLAADGDGSSYLERPHISNVSAQAHTLDASWKNLKNAHFDFAAFLLERYPTEDIYFLARDAELLYDTAYLMANENEKPRLHLINVSRANMRDANLRNYLQQEGISEKSLLAGQKVLFVDTGFAGTIPRVIEELFSKEAQRNIKTQLIVSGTRDLPSSRSFLINLNPGTNTIDPSTMHGTIISYEHMPRFTERSSSYKNLNGTFIPSSGKSNHKSAGEDGKVDPKTALAYMEDIKASAEKSDTRKYFYSLRKEYGNAINLFEDSNISKDDKINILKGYTQQPKGLSFVIDLIDSSKNTPHPTTITYVDLGIKASQPVHNVKTELMKKYPQYVHIMENPTTEITNLFENKDSQTLGSLLDLGIMNDAELNSIIWHNLSNHNEFTEKILRLIIVSTLNKPMTKLEANKAIETLFHFFEKPQAAPYKEELKLLLDKSVNFDRYAVKTALQGILRNAPQIYINEINYLIDTQGFSKFTDAFNEYISFDKYSPIIIRLLIEGEPGKDYRDLGVYFSYFMRAKNSDLKSLVIHKLSVESIERNLSRILSFSPSKSSISFFVDMVPDLMKRKELQPIVREIITENKKSIPNAQEILSAKYTPESPMCRLLFAY